VFMAAVIWNNLQCCAAEVMQSRTSFMDPTCASPTNGYERGESSNSVTCQLLVVR
jgi:hypothetical protein